MRLRASIAAGLAAVAMAHSQPALSQATADEGALVREAVGAFERICLANRQAGAEAALAAIRALPGVTEQPELPLGRARLKPFLQGQLEFLIRPDRRGFGCFVAFQGDAASAGSVAEALGAIQGMTPRPPRNGRDGAQEWAVAGSRDLVRLAPNSAQGMLINLEARPPR